MNKVWLRTGGRIVLALFLVGLGLTGRVSADANLPPDGGVPSPVHTSAEYPFRILEPSPVTGMGRAALSPADLQVIPAPTLDMKVLVILDSQLSPGVGDGVSQMIVGYLDILGIPYDLIDVDGRLESSAPVITEEMLWDGVSHGHYYAIFLGSSTVWSPVAAGGISEGLTAAERDLIRAYERDLGVRRVTWYVYPEASQYGLDYVAGTSNPVTVTLTTQGNAVFSYLQPGLSMSLTAGYTNLATVASGATFTSLIQDASGHPVVGIFEPADAGQHMVVTAAGYYPATPPASLHARLWPYGIINWATKGIFLGERHLYFVPQPDDILSFGDRWDPVSHTVYYDDGFRLSASDLDNLLTWMNTLTSTVPNAADFKIEMPFNGEGALLDRNGNGTLQAGSLTERATVVQDSFVWLNHTYSHEDLTFASAELVRSEILSNTEVAQTLGFTDYVTNTLLTGAYSGLTNTHLINTAYDLGIRYILSNASLGGYNNPTPNTGIVPSYYPSDLLLVPRLANNIFYFASTPEQETDYYNMVFDKINNVYYCKAYYDDPNNAEPCYTYEELLDLTTNQALGFLLDFNINATMFHMNNLFAYDVPTSTKTLLGDYVESLYGKYNAYYNDDVPILSLRTQEIGEKMWDRMDYNASGVSGVIACSNDITLTVPVTAPATVKVPVTGIIHSAQNATTETYAGQDIATISMTPGQTLSVPADPSYAFAAGSVPSAVTGLQLTPNVDGSRRLTWSPVSGAFGYRIYRGDTVETMTEIAVVAGTSYVDPGATNATTYGVTAIADDCWKEESSVTTVRLAPTSVRLISFGARPAATLSVVPLVLVPLVGMALVLRGRRDRRS